MNKILEVLFCIFILVSIFLLGTITYYCIFSDGYKLGFETGNKAHCRGLVHE